MSSILASMVRMTADAIDPDSKKNTSQSSKKSGAIPTVKAMFVDPREQLLQEVLNNMNNYEINLNRKFRPSIPALYCHWFLSLLVLGECVLRLLLLFPVFLIVSVGWYFVLVLTCGRMATDYCSALGHYCRMIGLYINFLFGILGNILIPWDPPMYYWKASVELLRPEVPSTGMMIIKEYFMLLSDLICLCKILCRLSEPTATHNFP